MPYLSSPVDGAQLFYRDYRPTKSTKTLDPPTNPLPVLVFLHGWPSSSLMFESLMLPLCEQHHFRCIGLDRRGYGNSDWTGPSPAADDIDIDYDTFAKDVAAVVESLHLSSFVFLGASMGCGEGLLACHFSAALRATCKGYIWTGPSLPLPLQTPQNPQAFPREMWDSVLPGLITDRVSFARQILPGIFGADAGVEVAPGTLERFERIVERADVLAIWRTVEIITSRDFTEDLREFGKEGEREGEKGRGVPLLVLHGDRDAGMPYEASARIVRELVPRAEVKVYEKAAHGLCVTHAQRVVGDVLEFVRALEK